MVDCLHGPDFHCRGVPFPLGRRRVGAAPHGGSYRIRSHGHGKLFELVLCARILPGTAIRDQATFALVAITDLTAIHSESRRRSAFSPHPFLRAEQEVNVAAYHQDIRIVLV